MYFSNNCQICISSDSILPNLCKGAARARLIFVSAMPLTVNYTAINGLLSPLCLLRFFKAVISLSTPKTLQNPKKSQLFGILFQKSQEKFGFFIKKPYLCAVIFKSQV